MIIPKTLLRDNLLPLPVPMKALIMIKNERWVVDTYRKYKQNTNLVEKEWGDVEKSGYGDICPL